MPIEAVIFDMDGVLVDSEVYWLKSREEFARDLGKVWTDEYQRLTMGRSTIEWAHIMNDKLQPGMSLDEIMTDIKRRVMAHYDEHLPLRPGAIEAVKHAAANYRCGLASGSPTEIIKHVLKLTALDQIFEVMVYGDDVEHGKPAPDIYFKAAEQLGVAPANCIGIEDSGNGIRSLHAAGMKIIAAPSDAFPLSQELLDMAHHVVASLEEVTPELFKRLDV